MTALKMDLTAMCQPALSDLSVCAGRTLSNHHERVSANVLWTHFLLRTPLLTSLLGFVSRRNNVIIIAAAKLMAVRLPKDLTLDVFGLSDMLRDVRIASGNLLVCACLLN